MPAIESPFSRSWPLPARGPELFGHCVLLRLDPAASVAALQDEEATRSASLISRDWFLGVTLASGGAGLYAPDGRGFLSFKFCLIGTNLPTEYEPGAVPIAPLEPLIAERPAFNFVPALPVEGLYVHTYPCMYAIVSRIHDTPEKPLAMLSPDEHLRLRQYQSRDEYNQGMFEHAKEVAEYEAKQAVMLAVPPDEAPVIPIDAEQRSHPSISSVSGSDCDSEVSDIKYLLTEDMQARLRRVRIFVEVWLDPAFHPGTPTDPAKFKEATAEVEALWEDWKERVQAAGDGPDDTPIDVGLPYDDHAVLPEDAVDSRIEKDNLARQAAPSMPESETAPESPTHWLRPTETTKVFAGPIETRQDDQKAELNGGKILHNGEDAVTAALPTEHPLRMATAGDGPESQLANTSTSVTEPSSRKTGLSGVPKRSLAFLRGSLSNLRTKAEAIRVFSKAAKGQPVASS
ncbi:hypothetical protein AURDEDRAFT_171848 [Auricularia subglabra TFB-10046 SS5]|uniref:Uncharacterized protein n=1 Tax=Auricularia subglabra (strain TFB-10046 / SS5) TaxID=717982 RepID=J0DBT3_AURST|nr:hypothetical protein AURDEDRAFT_171848 [Auricularia subglabra TFB-10046 SS5]